MDVDHATIKSVGGFEALVAELRDEVSRMKCVLSMYEKAATQHNNALSGEEKKNDKVHEVNNSGDHVMIELEERVNQQSNIIANLQAVQSKLQDVVSSVEEKMHENEQKFLIMEKENKNLKEQCEAIHEDKGGYDDEIVHLRATVESLAGFVDGKELRRQEKNSLRLALREKISESARRDLDKKLLLAAQNGKKEEVMRLLSCGADVNARNDDNDTPLIWAAIGGHLAIVQALIAGGAEVNARNQYNNAAFIIASREGHLTIVQELIEAGADVNIGDETNETALILASQNGHLAVVEELLAAGAAVDARDDDNDTALTCTACRGHLDIVRTLVVSGANIYVKGYKNKTAIEWAAEKKHTDVVDFLRDAGTWE